jgi:hypothetical protein
MLCPSNFLQIFESLEVSIWNESSPKADSIFGFNLNNTMGPPVSLTASFCLTRTLIHESVPVLLPLLRLLCRMHRCVLLAALPLLRAVAAPHL